MIYLPIYVITWIFFLIFRTIVILLGLILIPPMAIFHKYTTKLERSIVNARLIINWKYKFMYPWSNDEDGVIAGDEFLESPTWFRMLYWSAIRNPANNLRFIPGISCKIDPSKVRFIGSHPRYLSGAIISDPHKERLLVYDRDEFRFISLTNCGLYSNLRIQFKMFHKIWRFWIGWKIYPHDKFGIADNNYRKHGAGFATQFKRIYPR